MALQKVSLATLACAGIILAGCDSGRFGDNRPIVIQPSPISSAPQGQVTQGDLPPADGFPQAPGQPGPSDQPMQTANLDTESSGVALTPMSVAGVWNASVGGMTCKVATPQTKYGQGYRAGPLKCPAAFSGISSWAVNGSKLMFYNSMGGLVATLVSTDGSQFSGQTVSGVPVMLSR